MYTQNCDLTISITGMGFDFRQELIWFWEVVRDSRQVSRMHSLCNFCSVLNFSVYNRKYNMFVINKTIKIAKTKSPFVEEKIQKSLVIRGKC